MTEVKQKELIECPCGCGKWGTPRAKKWRNGQRHTRNCDKTKCRQCRGSSEAKTSKVRERRMSRDLGARRVAGSGRGHGADMVVEGKLYIETTKNAHVARTLHNFWESEEMAGRVHDAMVLTEHTRNPWALHLRHEGETYLVLVPFASLAAITTQDFSRLKEFWSEDPDVIGTPIIWWGSKAVTDKRAALRDRCRHAQLPGALLLEWAGFGKGGVYGQVAAMTAEDWRHFMQLNDHESESIEW